MPSYIRIRDLPEGFSWNNRRAGRRVQCPKCGLGVRLYVPAIEAVCTRCRCECEVLTADPASAGNLLGGKSRPGPTSQPLKAGSGPPVPEGVS